MDDGRDFIVNIPICLQINIDLKRKTNYIYKKEFGTFSLQNMNTALKINSQTNILNNYVYL